MGARLPLLRQTGSGGGAQSPRSPQVTARSDADADAVCGPEMEGGGDRALWERGGWLGAGGSDLIWGRR